MVVALHLQVEDFGFSRGRGRDEVRVEKIENTVTLSIELLFHLGSVIPDSSHMLLIAFALLLLLDGRNDPP